MTVAVTRVINACVLLDIDGDFVLTDQCFRNSVGTRFREPFGLRVEDLPRLTAIVVGHRAPDHWQPRSTTSRCSTVITNGGATLTGTPPH